MYIYKLVKYKYAEMYDGENTTYIQCEDMGTHFISIEVALREIQDLLNRKIERAEKLKRENSPSKKALPYLRLNTFMYEQDGITDFHQLYGVVPVFVQE